MNWSVNSDPLYDFIGAFFEPNCTKNQYSFSKKKLHDLYIKWCNDCEVPEHKRRVSMKAFTIALQAHNFVPERKREVGESYEVFATTQHMQRRNLTEIIDLDYHSKLNF